MYVITARLRSRPGMADAYDALLRSVVNSCAGEACFVLFNVHRGGADGRDFLLYEIWTDKERYEAVRAAPFFRAYLSARDGLVEPEIERSDWSLTRSVRAPSL